VRLAGGGLSGRLEVLFSGQWGTVCDDGFRYDAKGAQVVCRQLGLQGGVALTFIDDGSASGMPIWLDEVRCNGHEMRIEDCRHNSWGVHNCYHSEDVGVRCDQQAFTDPPPTQVRLVSNASGIQGRLEVYYAGQWGTVCDDRFEDIDAQVVCRQLGLYGGRVERTSLYGPGNSGMIWLDEVACNGQESRIQDCSHNGWGVHNCDHGEDVGLTCEVQPTNAQPIATVRLVGDGSDSGVQGRLEVFRDGQWGTLCSRHSFGTSDAQVVCRQLGLQGGSVEPIALFGRARDTMPIWPASVLCQGWEQRIENCNYIVHSGHNDCDHSEDVAVACTSPYATAVPPPYATTVPPPYATTVPPPPSYTTSVLLPYSTGVPLSSTTSGKTAFQKFINNQWQIWCTLLPWVACFGAFFIIFVCYHKWTSRRKLLLDAREHSSDDGTSSDEGDLVSTLLIGTMHRLLTMISMIVLK